MTKTDGRHGQLVTRLTQSIGCEPIISSGNAGGRRIVLASARWLSAKMPTRTMNLGMGIHCSQKSMTPHCNGRFGDAPAELASKASANQKSRLSQRVGMLHVCTP